MVGGLGEVTTVVVDDIDIREQVRLTVRRCDVGAIGAHQQPVSLWPGSVAHAHPSDDLPLHDEIVLLAVQPTALRVLLVVDTGRRPPTIQKI